MKECRDAVIVAYGRSPLCKGRKGGLAKVHPIDFGAEVLQGVLKQVPGLDPSEIEDVIVGCAFPEGMQGLNFARIISVRAGLPLCVAGHTTNRFCASGLQAIAEASNMIACHQADVVVAGGVESMTVTDRSMHPEWFDSWVAENVPGIYMDMGITAENVAERFDVSREAMDEFAVASHQKAHIAQTSGILNQGIIPVHGYNAEGERVLLTVDEGIRPNTNMESLAKLKSPFKEDGNVTAATSSQITDGASFVIVMAAEKAAELGIEPIARLTAFAVAGVDPSVMGIGPMEAVPKVLKQAKLSLNDFDVIEINERRSPLPVCESWGCRKKRQIPMEGPFLWDILLVQQARCWSVRPSPI